MSYAISGATSSTDAELIAIYQAIRWANNHLQEDFLILTDSRAAINILCSPPWKFRSQPCWQSPKPLPIAKPKEKSSSPGCLVIQESMAMSLLTQRPVEDGFWLPLSASNLLSGASDAASLLTPIKNVPVTGNASSLRISSHSPPQTSPQTSSPAFQDVGKPPLTDSGWDEPTLLNSRPVSASQRTTHVSFAIMTVELSTISS
jgi:hypothetical protein